MSIATPKLHQALPSYLGGKRRLLPWIAGALHSVCPRATWEQLTFIDAFMGGGTVSLWARQQGFRAVLTNDVSARSNLIGRALFTPGAAKLTPADGLWLTQPLPEGAGWIETTYAPAVFSSRHAKLLDTGFYWATRHPNSRKRPLLALVMWHLANTCVAFSTSLGTSNRPMAEALDGLRDWATISPKRFSDGSIQQLCQPSWAMLPRILQRVNAGLCGGSPVTLSQADALTWLPTVQGDVLYADPPYCDTANYERSNAVLDSLLAGENSTTALPVSPFSKGLDAVHDLLDAAQHIPIWLLSYGNKQMSCEDLVALVKQHAGAREVVGFSKAYRHMTHVSRAVNNQELLIVAYPKTRGVGS